MRILLVGAHPTAQGPIPKLSRFMKQGFEELGCQVTMAYWGQHQPQESLVRKMVERPLDAVGNVKLFKQIQPDILFLNTSHDWRALVRDSPLVLAARRLNLPFVLLYHGTCSQALSAPSARIQRAIFGWRLRSAAGTFVLARSEEHALKTIWPGVRIAPMRYPFSPMRERQTPPLSEREQANDPVLVFVGRLIERKGILDLIRAMPAALAQHPCRLLILGGGPLMKRARILTQDLGLEKHVTFAGQVDQDGVLGGLKKASVFVLPTFHSEGFPVAVLEALSAGLPIITTRMAGLPDWLEEGRNALFARPQAPTELAAKIVSLLNNRPLCERMQAANLELIREFEPVTVMREYLAWMRIWTGRSTTT